MHPIILSLFTGSVVYVAVARVLYGFGDLYSVIALHRLETFHQALLRLDIADEEREELKFFIFAPRDAV